MEIQPQDQRDYETGIALLRSMVKPDKRCHSAMRQMGAQLEDGLSEEDFRTSVKNFVGQEKPLKTITFAFSKFLYTEIWKYIKANDLPALLEHIEALRVKMERAQIEPIGEIHILSRILHERIAFRFRHYISALMEGNIIAEDSKVERLGQYADHLDLLVSQKLTDMNFDGAREQISSAVGNAIGTIQGTLTTVPKVFWRQFGEDMGIDAMEGLVPSIKEMLILQSMLHIGRFGSVMRQTVSQENGTPFAPEAYVMGLNTRNRLSMATRPELIRRAIPNENQNTRQLGCPMTSEVGNFVDVLWQVLKPTFAKALSSSDSARDYRG